MVIKLQETFKKKYNWQHNERNQGDNRGPPYQQDHHRGPPYQYDHYGGQNRTPIPTYHWFDPIREHQDQHNDQRYYQNQHDHNTQCPFLDRGEITPLGDHHRI